jgi:hypothetical protein
VHIDAQKAEVENSMLGSKAAKVEIISLLNSIACLVRA